MTNGRLAGQSTVVTGAGSGLGLALAERFVDEGALLTVLERSAEKVALLEERFGESVTCVQGDVTSADDNDAVVRAAVERHGRLDTFVGNVGLWDFGRALSTIPLSQLGGAFDEMFAVNVKGYLLGARAAIEPLRASRGSMIFTLSNASFYPAGGGALYTATKHAGVGLVRQLAYELAPTVRVNGVAPGGMATDLRGPESLGQHSSSIAEVVPVQDYMKNHGALELDVVPADYVGAYVFLAAAPESRTTTGAVLDVSAVGVPHRSPGAAT